VKACPSTPSVGRSTLILAIVLLSLPLLFTITLIVPPSTQKRIPSEEAADYLGHLGTVCGRVSRVRCDPKAINALLIFGDPESPSFTTSILTPARDVKRKYEGKQVCVVGRIVDAWEPSGFPSITVTDESHISIE